MTRTRISGNDRGQAYTLEGLIGAMIVLMAVLFAMQSAVITPSTGGLADRTVQSQIQQETQDALVVAALSNETNLSYMARYWDDDGGFENASGPDDPENPDHATYTAEEFKHFALGEILSNRFGETGWNYNVEIHSVGDDTDHRTLVYQGSPSSSAVTASYTVTLYDNQNVTGENSNENISDVDDAPIGNMNGQSLYNVVEVRVIVW